MVGCIRTLDRLGTPVNPISRNGMVSVIAVEMVTSDLKLLSIICAAVAKDADIQRYETSGQERVTGNRLLPRFSSPHRSLLEYGTHVEGDFLA